MHAVTLQESWGRACAPGRQRHREQECNLKIRDTEIRISNKHGILEYGGNGIVSKIVDYLYKDATIYLSRKYEIATKSHAVRFK